MKQSCRLIPRLLSVLLVLVFAHSTKATTAVMIPDAELIVNSRIILYGRVISATSDWDSSHSMVWTYVEVSVERLLKGELTQTTIVLRQLGGTVGESGIRIDGQPVFTPGERVLLYLNTGADGTLHAAHNFMGKFVVKTDSTGAEFVERSVDQNEIEILASADAGEVTNRASLQTYLRTIRRTLRREAVRVAEMEASRIDQPLVAVPTEFSRIRKNSGEFSTEFAFFSAPVRWMEADAGQPIRYFINSNASPVAGGGSTEITRAMSAWPGQSGAAVQLQLAGQTGSCGIAVDNRNTISFGDCMNQLDPPIGCAGVVALTSIAFVQDVRVIGGVTFNRLIEADTVFNRGMDCFLSTSANLAEVACHELGHSIGLGHSSDSASMMWATAHGHGRDATLGADDKAGVLAIYPASHGGPGPGGGGTISIATSSLLDGVAGLRYTAQLAAAGGTPPYRWVIVGGALPSGLTLSSSGLLDGTPNFSGSSLFAAQVIDSGTPALTDTKWLSLSIRSNGSSDFPAVIGIKIKGTKKLWVFGANFRANSMILLNGALFEPRIFAQEGSVDQLLAKGKLNLGPPGTNVVVVINIDNRSTPFIF